MNTFSMISATRITMAVAAVVMLAGCATNGSALSSKSAGITRNDAIYMARVERAAKARNVRVLWVNPPDKETKGRVAVR